MHDFLVLCILHEFFVNHSYSLIPELSSPKWTYILIQFFQEHAEVFVYVLFITLHALIIGPGL